MITEDELRELNELDAKLLKEFERILLHYRLNWPFMSPEQKERLVREVEEWFKEGR